MQANQITNASAATTGTLQLDISKLEVAKCMIEHGGSFVQALGHALLRADKMNSDRIKLAFPDYWQTYEGISARTDLQVLAESIP